MTSRGRPHLHRARRRAGVARVIGATLSVLTMATATAGTAGASTQSTPPVMVLSTSGTPAEATVDNTGILSLAPSLSGGGGAAYNDPPLTVALPSGEASAAGAVTALPSATTTTSLTASATTTSTTTSSTTTSSTTSTSTTSTTPGTGGEIGPGPLPAPVLPPVLEITASAPPTAVAAKSFVLKLSISLANRGGPAWHGPAFSVDLPARTTLAKPAPKAAGWSCSLSAGGAVLICTWKAKVPIPAGSAMGSVSATVDVSASASGRVTSDATLADTPDAAVPVRARATVLISKLEKAKSPIRPKYGYRLVATDGGVFGFGNAEFYGSCQLTSKPCGVTRKVAISAVASLPTGGGYWLAATDGSVYAFGRARSYASCPVGEKVCGKNYPPIDGIAATPDGRGYWLVATNGTVFAFGDALAYGSCAGTKSACGQLHGRIVGMAVTADGKGYWLAESTGLVFSFGDASKLATCTTAGGPCAKLLNRVTGIAATSRAEGYWLVGSGGRVFSFGNAKFLGDAYSTNQQKKLKGAVVGITPMANDAGYWLVTSDGVVLAIKAASYMGDLLTAKVKNLAHPVVGIAST